MFTILSGSLPASRTHARRSWYWFSAPWHDHLGTLTITQSRSAKPGAACEVETYDCEDCTPWPSGERTLVLRKRSDESALYEVTVGGRRDRCTCPAQQAGRRTYCRHTEAVRALLDAGGPGGAFPAPGDSEAMHYAWGRTGGGL